MPENLPKKRSSDASTILFVVILSVVSAIILSTLASALKKPQEIAKEFDRSKQMMIAANILSHNGYFLTKNDEGVNIPAKYAPGGILVPGTNDAIATRDQILEVFKIRLRPFLVNKEGNTATFKEAGLSQEHYLSEYKKEGYYVPEWMLAYEILPNPKEADDKKETEPSGYIFPVNGYGLWDAIYGYIAIETNGNTVLGISWYDQKETPGLGADIAEAAWQKEFPGKHIFQESPSGETDFKTAPIGISVVKGKVSEVLGDSPKSKSAVDGIAGATLTGYGVTDAYKESLNPYRPFLIKIHEKSLKDNKGEA